MLYEYRLSNRRTRCIALCNVSGVEDYLYSSARDFAGLPCLLKIVQTLMPTEKMPLMRTVR